MMVTSLCKLYVSSSNTASGGVFENVRYFRKVEDGVSPSVDGEGQNQYRYDVHEQSGKSLLDRKSLMRQTMNKYASYGKHIMLHSIAGSEASNERRKKINKKDKASFSSFFLYSGKADTDQPHTHLISSLLSFNRERRWGTTDFFATSFLHFSLFSTAHWDLPNSRPVHSLMSSSHLFVCPPCLLPPFTVPCKMVLARPNEQET